MNTRNRTLGGFGIAVAALAILSVTACDPYIAANNAAPVVLGVSMTDTNYNEIVPPDAPGCLAPYPQVDKAWADVAFPGLCNPDNAAFGIPSVCPVVCFPPRMGPGYAPLFTGNLGGTYQTTLPGVLSTFTYSLPTTYVLGAISPVPPVYDNQDFGGDVHLRHDPDPLQQAPGSQDRPARSARLPAAHHFGGLKVFRDTVDVTATHAVCYNPNSDTEYWGASITVTSPDLDPDTETEVSLPNSTYRVVGTVQDQQGNSAERRRHRHHRHQRRRAPRRRREVEGRSRASGPGR